MAKEKLAYVPPPQPETVRRVYALPPDLVKRIYRYGFERGHQSEVAIVRELLVAALDAADAQHRID